MARYRSVGGFVVCLLGPLLGGSGLPGRIAPARSAAPPVTVVPFRGPRLTVICRAHGYSYFNLPEDRVISLGSTIGF
jgi:hypothetical protein